jgi:hypothetical protein
MEGVRATGRAQRVVGLLVLLGAGVLSLPLSAALLDGRSTENLILPAQLAAMALLGAVLGVLLPGLTRAGASGARRAVLGALIGVGGALVGIVVFFLLLNGVTGA